jgi:FolB domain-containing protein
MAAGILSNIEGEGMDKIIISDLLIRGVIGISERERESPQDILVNITIYTDISKAARSDNVEDSVNYRTISKKVLAHTETIKRYTVEALAEDIAQLCLEHPMAKSVVVRVEKPGAVRFSRSVGVEIERHRS